MKPSSIVLALLVSLAFSAPALAAKGGNGNGNGGGESSSGESGGSDNAGGGDNGNNGSDGGNGNGNAGGNGNGNAYGHDKQDTAPENGDDAVTVTVVPNDQQAVQEAVKANKALPLEEITARVSNDTSGRILDVQLVRFRDVYLYDVTVLEQNGVLHKLYYDARSGQPVRTK